MTNEQPVFTSTPLPEEPPKKPAKRRAKRKPKAEKKAVEPEPAPAVPAPVLARAPNTVNEKEISDALTSIYQNSDGALPDMQNIAIKKSSPLKKLLAFFIFGSAAAAVCAWAYWFYSPTKKAGADDLVAVQVQGPQEISAGVTTTYDIIYANNSEVNLRNVRVNIVYPENFIMATSSVSASNEGNNEWELGALSAHRRGTISVTGRTFDVLNAAATLRATLFYSPENFNSELQKDSLLTSKITDSPLSINITGPADVPAGLETSYQFTVTGTQLVSYASFNITPILPPNFTLTASIPPLAKDGVWRGKPAIAAASTSTSSTAATGPVSYTLKGIWADSTTSIPLAATFSLNPALKSNSYAVAQAQLPVRVTAGALSLNLAINGSLHTASTTLGSTLSATIRLKNTTDKSIKNISLKTFFDAPSIKNQSVLKWAALKDTHDGDTQGTQLDTTTRRGTLTWNGKKVTSLSVLKPNEEVVLDFELPIKDAKEADWGLVTTSTILAGSSATFTSADGTNQTITGSPLYITINSDTSLEVREAAGSTATDHALTWVLNNTFHTLKDITVTAHVYTGATIIHDTNPDAGVLSVDESGSVLTWQIPQMPDSTDVLTAPFVVSMPKPDPSQNTLLSKTTLTATDAVTGQSIFLESSELPL